MELCSRAAALLNGFANYGNPIEIVLRRAFQRTGEMTIVDRRTKVSVVSMRRSYHMFSTSWYEQDYDVGACSIRKDDVVVDIGANQGFFTCYAAQRGARVYAFEPDPKMYELLRRNIQRNGFSDRVISECTAVADFEGKAELYCSTFLDGGSNTLYPDHYHAIGSRQGEQTGTVCVPVKRLDSVLPKNGRIRLLKLDCEGAELAILRDLREPERFDSMALEFHPSAYPVDELIRTIVEYGTHQVYQTRGDTVHAIRTEVLLEYARNRSC